MRGCSPPTARPSADTARVRLLQICYDEATHAALPPGFEALDNRANPRPDWREYWPMRTWLRSHTLEDDTYYGFFSPKFGAKTNLTAAAVAAFAAAQQASVVSLSPFIDQSAFFLNAFEQGEANHPGLIDASEAFLAMAGLPLSLRTLVADHTGTVFSNFFVARRAFWQDWTALTDALFDCCEAGGTPLAERLTGPADYRWAGDVQMKVFVMERLVCALLADGRHDCVAWDPFALPRGGSLVATRDHAVVLAEALKVAYRRDRNPAFLRAWAEHRARTIAEVTGAAGAA